jgi:hypothetical protein
MTAVLGPLPCLTCKQPVWWDRVGPQLRLMQTSPGGRVRRHACLVACGAWMPFAKERCARRPGHRGSHRSRYVMDSEARMRRGKWAA